MLPNMVLLIIFCSAISYSTFYNTASYSAQYCQLLCTILLVTLYSTASYSVRYCQLFCTILLVTLHNTASYSVQYCQLLCTILLVTLYNISSYSVQYCQLLCTILLVILYSTASYSVQYFQLLCTVPLVTLHNSASCSNSTANECCWYCLTIFVGQSMTTDLSTFRNTIEASSNSSHTSSNPFTPYPLLLPTSKLTYALLAVLYSSIVLTVGN